MATPVSLCVCVYVCVCEWERERKRELVDIHPTSDRHLLQLQTTDYRLHTLPYLTLHIRHPLRQTGHQSRHCSLQQLSEANKNLPTLLHCPRLIARA